MDIGPGDFVECVRDDPGGATLRPVMAGEVLRIRAMDPFPGYCLPCDACGADDLGFSLECDPAPVFGGYIGVRCPCDYRPIYRPKADLIEGLLTPIREGVEA